MVDSRSLVSEGHIGFPLVSVYLIGWGLCALRRPLLGFPRPVFIKKYFVGNIQGGVWRTHSAFLPHREEKNFRFQERYFRDVYLTTPLLSFFYRPTNFSLQFTWILGGDIVYQNMHSEDGIGRFKAHIPSLIEIWINGHLFIFFFYLATGPRDFAVFIPMLMDGRLSRIPRFFFVLCRRFQIRKSENEF